MNIVLRELKANLKSLIIWSLSMVFVIYSGMIKYAGYQSAGQSMKELMDQIPPAMMAVLGFNGLDLTSMSGFYSMFFLYFLLLAGIHAVMLGAVILSKEERDKTADFLYVKPVLRNRIISTKLIAALINVAVLNIVTLLSSMFFVNIFAKGENINNQIVNLMIALFILQVLFASIGAGISALVSNTKKATSLSTLVLLSTFLLSVAIDLYGKIDYLKYFTPFKYFPAARIVRERLFDPVFIFISLVITITFISITYVFYNKKDLRV